MSANHEHPLRKQPARKKTRPHEYENKLPLPRRAMPARKTIKEKEIAKKQPFKNWYKTSEVNLFERHSSPQLTGVGTQGCVK